jgi:hypothetical protein
MPVAKTVTQMYQEPNGTLMTRMWYPGPKGEQLMKEFPSLSQSRLEDSSFTWSLEDVFIKPKVSGTNLGLYELPVNPTADPTWKGKTV